MNKTDSLENYCRKEASHLLDEVKSVRSLLKEHKPSIEAFWGKNY